MSSQSWEKPHGEDDIKHHSYPMCPKDQGLQWCMLIPRINKFFFYLVVHTHPSWAEQWWETLYLEWRQAVVCKSLLWYFSGSLPVDWPFTRCLIFAVGYLLNACMYMHSQLAEASFSESLFLLIELLILVICKSHTLNTHCRSMNM